MFQVDEELDALISRIRLEEGNTEFWKRRFLGEGLTGDHETPIAEGKSESSEVQDDVDAIEVSAKEVEDDEADDDDDDGDEDEEAEQVEEEVEPVENQDVERIKEKEVESKKPLQMIGVQLLKDSDQPSATSKKLKRRKSRHNVEV